jgi:hypothetical protein
MTLLVNVDFDGVLIPNYFEKQLIERLSGIVLEDKISDFQTDVFDWYIKMVNTSPLAPLNTGLLRFFAQNKDKFALRLWTNRNDDLMRKTLSNLEPFKSTFDSFEFHAGHKIDSRVEGMVIDNTPKYLTCGELGGIHYEWKGGDI